MVGEGFIKGDSLCDNSILISMFFVRSNRIFDKLHHRRNAILEKKASNKLKDSLINPRKETKNHGQSFDSYDNFIDDFDHHGHSGLHPVLCHAHGAAQELSSLPCRPLPILHAHQ